MPVSAEEIGTDDVEILAESTRWLYYDVPRNSRIKLGTVAGGDSVKNGW
jgi:hypothetical protein